MAKTIKSAKAPVKKTKATALPIVSVNEIILGKLQALAIESHLQAEITWCLGSFSHDNNPVGLYDTAAKALEILKTEHAKKTKGITIKLISDIEKALTTK
jgi:hypothetical protein